MILPSEESLLTRAVHCVIRPHPAAVSVSHRINASPTVSRNPSFGLTDRYGPYKGTRSAVPRAVQIVHRQVYVDAQPAGPGPIWEIHCEPDAIWVVSRTGEGLLVQGPSFLRSLAGDVF